MFERLSDSFVRTRSPIGDGWILAEDEASFRAGPRDRPSSAVRLLPGGDAWYLLQGADRELLVPDPGRRRLLWTPRVWPGAVIAGGEVVGTWRRAGPRVTIEPWGRLSTKDRDAIAAEGESLPVPEVGGRLAVQFQA
jgi:hypothetical protein